MKKFNIRVIRVDEYDVEIDENIINDEWIEDFQHYMWKVDEDEPYHDLAKHIALMRARFGSHQFMEGFGLINVVGEYYTDKEKEMLSPGFKINVVDEENDVSFDITEI